jgi:hypothetical protein
MIVCGGPVSCRVERTRSSTEVYVRHIDASGASGRQATPAAGDQCRRDLKSHQAWSVHHIEPAVAQRDPLDQSELVVAIHVAKPLNTFVAGSAIELDQDPIVVVADIAQVWQPVSPPLSIPTRQSVGAFDLMQELHFQRRLGTGYHITQDVGEKLPMFVTAALVHGVKQPTGCCSPALDCLGDQSNEIGLACCCRQVQHRVFDSQTRWSTEGTRRSRTWTLSAEAPFATNPSTPTHWNQDVNWSRRLIDQVVQEA